MAKGLKTGGRKKGTPNRKSMELQAKLASLEFDPTVELVAELRKPNIATVSDGESGEATIDGFNKDRAKILMALHEFIYPRKKSIETAGEAQDDAIDVTPEDERLEAFDEAELVQIARLPKAKP